MYRRALAAATLALAVSFAACGGGGGEKLIPTDDAEDTADDILLRARDLPDSGWEIIGEDEFEPSDSEPPLETDECEAYTDLINRARAHHEDRSEARAQRSLSREVKGSDEPLQVEITVILFDDEKKAEEGMKRMTAAVTSKDYQSCFSDLLDEAGADDIEFPKAQASAPGKGGFAVTFAASVEGEDLRSEQYGWRQGNVLLGVGVSGAKDDVTDDLIKETIKKLQDSAKAQAK